MGDEGPEKNIAHLTDYNAISTERAAKSGATKARIGANGGTNAGADLAQIDPRLARLIVVFGILVVSQMLLAE